ncbi:MAG TPA: 3-methyl-2-oxobutanoate hydroxymethyltransferase [Desulfobacteraceae bacterium]|nr:3-methyl-2-oxobutanoate hydroxymethyltransferase [Desulfobacteraceae bacterium]
MAQKLTVKDILARKAQGKKISVLTAYDTAMARMLDDSGIDILLVGDSLGMVVLGYDSTVPVTMEEMLHHARAVSRGTTRALVVGDMPFGSYQAGLTDAVANGVRFMKEAGCDAVKIEGGIEMCDVVRAFDRAGIPVMGHVGLTPQTVGRLGGFKVQGTDIDSARKMIDDVRALADAGVFAVVVECVPGDLGRIVTAEVPVPIIGIGAGPDCDGQVLVVNDMLGLFDRFTPSFVKKYADLGPVIRQAAARYRDEVEEGAFPAAEQTFPSPMDYSSLLKRG